MIKSLICFLIGHQKSRESASNIYKWHAFYKDKAWCKRCKRYVDYL